MAATSDFWKKRFRPNLLQITIQKHGRKMIKKRAVSYVRLLFNCHASVLLIFSTAVRLCCSASHELPFTCTTFLRMTNKIFSTVSFSESWSAMFWPASVLKTIESSGNRDSLKTVCPFPALQVDLKEKRQSCSMGTTQKYSLKWNDFTVNVASTFRDLHSRYVFLIIMVVQLTFWLRLFVLLGL